MLHAHVLSVFDMAGLSTSEIQEENFPLKKLDCEFGSDAGAHIQPVLRLSSCQDGGLKDPKAGYVAVDLLWFLIIIAK